jgi:hypothetical protein
MDTFWRVERILEMKDAQLSGWWREVAGQAACVGLLVGVPLALFGGGVLALHTAASAYARSHPQAKPTLSLPPGHTLTLSAEERPLPYTVEAGAKLTCPSPLSRSFACTTPSGEEMSCEGTEVQNVFHCSQPWDGQILSERNGIFGRDADALANYDRTQKEFSCDLTCSPKVPDIRPH